MFNEQSFTMDFEKKQNAIHLGLTGDFDGCAAYEVTTFLQNRFSLGDRVFVSTEKLRLVDPAGRNVFRALLRRIGIPLDSLYFKGEQAAALAPDGSKVIKMKKCGCGRDCATCGKKHQPGHSGPGREEGQ